MGPSDEALAQLALKEDPDAFAELVNRYQKGIYNLAYRLTGERDEAQDLAQETFLRAYAALPSFQTDRRFSPWLYRIATNLCFDYLKRRGRLGTTPIEDFEAEGAEMPLPDWSMEPARALERKETQEEVQAAILSLPEKYRAVVILRHIEGLSYSEMAEVLTLPLGTIKTHLYRARELLKARLQEGGVVK